MAEVRTVHRPVFHLVSEEYRPLLERLHKRALEEDYTYNTGTVPLRTVKRVEERHDQLSPRQSMRFLELGPGWGKGLSLLEKFKQLEIHTLSPTDPVHAPGSTRKHTGWAEETIFPGAMDLIHSRNGAIMHSANSVISLENALRSLRQGGSLILHPTELRLSLKDKSLEGKIREIDEERIRNTGKTKPPEDPMSLFEEVKATLHRWLAKFRENPGNRKHLESQNGFFAGYGLLQTLKRQGFYVPTDEEFINAAIDRQFENTDRNLLVITRAKRHARLQPYYANPHLNQIPIRF